MAKLTDDKIIAQVDAQRKKAAQHQEELSQSREQFYRTYRAAPYGNERQGWSQTVLPVTWNIVESLKPGLLEIFTGDFFSLAPASDKGQPLATGMDGMQVPQMPMQMAPGIAGAVGVPNTPTKPRDAAKDIQDYLRHKIYNQMDGEQIIDDWLHYCLTSHYGVLKVTHREDYKEIREDYESVTPDQMAMIMSDGNVTVSKYEDVLDETGAILGHENVKTIRKEVSYSGPWVETIPPRELYFVPGYASLDKCPYVAHVVKRDLDYILRQERAGVYRKGSFKRVQEDLDGKPNTTETDGEVHALFEVDGFEVPSDRNLVGTEKPVLGQNEVLVEEIYTRMDIDGDGLLESVILTLCGNTVLREPIENPYGSPPFELGTILSEPDKIVGRPIPELFDPWQRMMTNMTRVIQDAAMLSTARGWKTNDAKIKKALEQWSPGSVVQSQNMAAQVELLDFGSPNGFVLQALERTQYEIDKASGVNEAMQGLDKEAMNQTASGMRMKLNASQERQRLIARRLSRTWKRVIRRMLDCLRIYPPTDDLRLLGRDITITEDDLRAEYSVNISVGVGPADKERNAAMFGQLAALLMSPAAVQMGLGNPQNVTAALRRQYEYLDADVSDILPEEEQMPQIMQMQQQLGQAQQQMQQMGEQMQKLQQDNQQLQQQAAKGNPELEAAKFQTDTALKQRELELKAAIEGAKIQLERDKMMLDAHHAMQVAQEPKAEMEEPEEKMQQPQVVVVPMPNGNGQKQIQIVRDANGAIAGANVIEG